MVTLQNANIKVSYYPFSDHSRRQFWIQKLENLDIAYGKNSYLYSMHFLSSVFTYQGH